MAKTTKRTRRALARIGSGTGWYLHCRLSQTAERLPGTQVSREAKQRLKMMDCARTHSVAATCRLFSIARSTCSRWAKRYDHQRLSLLENRSSRPHRCRRPPWSAAQAEAVRQAPTSCASPQRIRAIQVGGGSEFMAELETACRAWGIVLFVLPPRSPKLNGHAKRANGTHRREF